MGNDNMNVWERGPILIRGYMFVTKGKDKKKGEKMSKSTIYGQSWPRDLSQVWKRWGRGGGEGEGHKIKNRSKQRSQKRNAQVVVEEKKSHHGRGG